MLRGSGRLLLGPLVAILAALPVAGALGRGAATSSTSSPARPAQRSAQGCAGDSSPHNARNPLDLSQAPGSDPLKGARLFVNGPRHGVAAGAVASLLGIEPARFADSFSWASFQAALGGGAYSQRLNADPTLRRKVRALEKIAAEPEAQRLSSFSAGGAPDEISAQVNEIFCGELIADPGSVPIITTYFAHSAVNGCSRHAISAAMPVFRRRVNELTAAGGNHRAVYLLEIDALGRSSCFARAGALPAWEAMLRYEVDRMAALPHAVVYLEAGYSGANSAAYTASALNMAGIRRIRGFFTNDTHFNWTIDEVRWAEKVSRLTHGARYIVNTAQSGDGPLVIRRSGHLRESLCNPPGRALGAPDTTVTGFPHADAFLWTRVPGLSDGSCGGGPPSGDFWVERAVGMAERANARLGPHDRSQPY